MSGNGALSLDFKPIGKLGKGIVSAKRAGESVHTDKIDISHASDRAGFVTSLCKGRPGIDRKAIAAELERLAGQCVVDDAEADSAERCAQAQLLVQLAEGAELFHDGDVGYATVEVGGHYETHALNGRSFRQWLSRKYWVAYTKAPNSQGLQDAINTLIAKAMFEGTETRTWVRLASLGDTIYLDLGNERWEAVEITSSDWRVIANPPIKFVRRRGMLPLPSPLPGGKISDFRPLVNAKDDSIWVLIVAWLLMALNPRGPYPILAINGEQGSAKSTTCRILRRLIDPNKADLRTAPKDERDLAIAANNAHIIAFDNLSSISPALSDAVCRLSTGSGFATRELYTDDSEIIFDAARLVLFNGIEELATRPDLLDRCIAITLPTIPDNDRLAEMEVWAKFEAIRPGVLGALLDAVATALRRIESVELDSLPRMADFVKWIVAAEPALPWSAGTFMEAYAGNREAANDLAIEASAVGQALLAFVRGRGDWEGTSLELLDELTAETYPGTHARKPNDWPKTAKAMNNAVRRLAPPLRRLGIDVLIPNRTGKARKIVLKWVGDSSSPPSPPSHEGPVVRTTSVMSDGQAAANDGPNGRASSPVRADADPRTPRADDCDDGDGLFLGQSEEPMAGLPDVGPQQRPQVQKKAGVRI